MSQKKKTTAQSKRPRKAPSNQTGGTAWGKKAAAAISGKMQSADMKKLILLNFPYIIAFYMVEKAAWLYRHCNGDTIVDRLMVLFMNFGLAYKSYLPSVHPFDLLVGLIGAAALKAVIYFKGKNAKKYRLGEEYGSARWGNAKDIEPFIDPVFENNVLLTQTERLMMSGRPKHPKYARNKNVIVIGGSGSGKTRFFVKPNLMQMPEKVSYVCTDPKGTIIIECGKMLSDAGYKIKVLNTINFKKSMHYNPFHYIRSEKDILKLVNTIIANTKGDGEKSGEDFWVKAERLLYCALIGYIYYEAPEEEQNFSTLLEFINASEAREDDEEFKNPVDELFEDLEKAKPEHFAVRQYKKYKLAAGKTAKSILISCGARLAPFDIKELRDLMAYDEMELDMLGDQRTAMFVIISDTDDTFNFVVSILYTQLFNLLCDKADDEHGGRLPYHVRLLLDEFANIGQIPKFDKLIATIRSREISASIILQSQSQLKTISNKDLSHGTPCAMKVACTVWLGAKGVKASDLSRLLLKEEQTAAYSVEIWKRFRKWGGIPTGITQNIKDLLASREIENIFENSDFIYMLNQASGDRQILAKQLNISPFQLSYVTNSNEGEGLLFYGNTIIPFKDKFDTSLKLYGLMTTKPNEIAKYREKKDA